jgi:hypothetical protein
MAKTQPHEWVYGEIGEQMLGWVRCGATIEIAASLCGVSEPQLDYWFVLALRFPSSPMAELIRDLREAAHLTGNGHSTTGSILGGGHGRKDDKPALLSWRDL